MTLRKLTGSIHKSNTSVIFINQIRMKIGMIGYGNPETTSGGNALKFYASVRLDIRKIQTLKNQDEVYGSRARVKVVKNKVAPPFREAQFDVLYGTGISRIGEIIDLGVDAKIMEKSGSWFAFGAERRGPGQGQRPGLPAGQPGHAGPDRGRAPLPPGHEPAQVRAHGRNPRRDVAARGHTPFRPSRTSTQGAPR